MADVALTLRFSRWRLLAVRCVIIGAAWAARLGVVSRYRLRPVLRWAPGFLCGSAFVAR